MTANMPLTHSREAPRFASDTEQGFKTFFDELEEVAKRAGLDDAQMIDWAQRYAGRAAESWEHVPCLHPDVLAHTPATWAQFKIEVRHLYSHLQADRRWTTRDLDTLLERTRGYRDMSREDLGDYHRSFLTYSAYLIAKGRYTARERDAAYLRGFPQPIRARILHRLSIKKPDVLPDDGYQFSDVHEAALFVLNARAPDDNPDSRAVIPKTEPAEQGSVSELIQAMSNLTRVFTANVQPRRGPPPSAPPPRLPRPATSQTTPGGVFQNVPRWNTLNPEQYTQNCVFCSAHDHFVRDCPIAADYLVQGKVIKNGYGKLSLPDGRYPPRNIPGKNLRERIDNYWTSEGLDEGQGRDAFATNFLEGPDECVFTIDIDPPAEEYYAHPDEQYDLFEEECDPDQEDYATTSIPHTPVENRYAPNPLSKYDDETLEQVELMQAQLDSIRNAQIYALQTGPKKVRFDGVEIARRTGPPRRDGRLPPAPTGPTPASRESGPSKPTPAPTQTQTNPANTSGKPGARAGDRQTQRPQGPMRPVSYPPRPPPDDSKYRFQAPVEHNVKTSDIVHRVLDSKVNLSARELLAVAPDLRKHVREIVTSKKISANTVEVNEVDAYLAGCFDAEPPSVFLDLVKYDSSSSAAASSLPLRVIHPTFGPGVEPECILDGGAQVVVMRKDVWSRLQAPIVASRAMPMESANASTTMTLGLIEDHPVQLGPITIYLQIQVVEEAPFEVLLGRPFFDVISCSEVSSAGGKHEIRVKDPKTGKLYVFATQPRIRKSPRPNPEEAVNFH